MTFEETEKYKLVMYKKRIENNASCEFCGKDLRINDAQFAHVIISSKQNLKKYGKEIIHHPDNGRYTCSACNVKAIIPNYKTELFEDHIKKIKKKLKKT